MVVVVAVGQPLTLWWRTSRAKGSFPYCKRDSIRLRVRPARSVLVEAEARAAPTLRVRDVDDGSVKVQIYQGGDRTDDLQAEARAMARSANASVYSPQLLVGKYGSRPVKVIRRTLKILIALGSFGLKLLVDQRNGVLNQNKRLRAAELRRIFTRLGPTFVKLGQGLSTRPDVCPPEYLEELSELQEGQNARRFKKLYADKEEVLVPDIFWDYTSGKVLTMEWVDGVKLNEQDAIERQGLKVLDLVNTGIQCSLRQLLEYGYFHADPHPGNLLATPEGKLAFLDFGMMSETPEEARFAIIGHVVHMVNRDYEAMARDYYALDFLSPDVDVSPIVPALRDFFDDALNSTVSELNFKTLVDGLGAVLYQYPFNVPAYYALILRSLTVLEGLALYADPNFKVLAASYPYFAKRLLTDPNPYLRDALIELLFKDGKFRWNRLENLLIQGKKDRDFSAKDALQPVLKLLLGSDGEELRTLVIKEAVRVTEAFIWGTVIDTYNSLPNFMRALVVNGNATGPLVMSIAEQESMIELRDQVFRIWGLLRSSESFDPALLQPILQVLQQPEARNLGERVIGGITQRLAARLLQQVLRVPTTASASTL
ncbi:protein ACTIVITY OF BC1 COMPLEX KINASE 3, chloroplastic isoform X2 [Prunus avium]|uniref:Protein ACTIVITY OF BC1 COMPLEX KINASE 3, chloroplastic isoform X2 n=1 Tax=Prunus avium TaxID=42229 RepID=A0A6P5SG86_PRUAV|nr:protein ACTIVITY OF BC1 COMPLEX KINASE 3, chloroplastic isoform X2 [Prunus avium]